MSKETEDAISEKSELQELFIEKLVELRLKEELKRHYSALFERSTALSEKYVALLGDMAKNMAQFEKTLNSIDAQVQELYKRVFGKQWEKYTA